MNEQEVIGYSVYVGIDWADKKHDVCICPKLPLRWVCWASRISHQRTLVGISSEPKADKLAFLVSGMGSFFAGRSDRLHTYFGRQVHRLF